MISLNSSFHRHSTSPINSMVSLRHRFFMQKSHNAILRGESLFKADLSDMCGVTHQDDEEGLDLEELEIQIMRIATGKTNNLKILYGRCMRHANVNLCPMGGIGFYLMHRFHTLKEKIDFSENTKWYHIKLLINSLGTNREEPMDDQPYARFIREACEALGIDPGHYIHFGRCVGAATADLKEMEGYDQVNLSITIYGLSPFIVRL